MSRNLEGWIVLVLGGTGLVGSHVVRSFSERGARVRVVVREKSRRDVIEGLPGVHFVPGDIYEPESLKAAAGGCHILVHAAAPYPSRAFGKGREMARARRSLANVIDAFQANAAGGPVDWDRIPDGLVRMVYVSSPTTIAPPGAEDRLANETDVYEKPPDAAAYFHVKSFMEAEMTSSAARVGLPVVIVNPTFVFDAFDTKPTTGQLILSVARRQLPVLLPGHVNVVPGRDVGEGVVLAALEGVPGERYILGGENMSLQDLIRRIARAAGVTPPKTTLPLSIAEGIAWISEVVALATPGVPPLLPINGLHMLKRSIPLDSGRAERELGWSAGPVNAAIERAVRWFRDEGKLKG